MLFKGGKEMTLNKGGKDILPQMTEEDILEAEQKPHLGPALGSPEEVRSETMSMLLEMQKSFSVRKALPEEGA